MSESPDIVTRIDGRAGRITLTRPQALNALTLDMVRAIDAALVDWAQDPGARLVLIEGEGPRAFCSGGDIADVYRSGRRGDFEEGRRFWADEYRMNARIVRLGKPYVALMHGYVMGGGVGVSAHGTHRIVGESTQLAMPECMIGLIPDIGATHILGRAPGRLGEYLGLTGHRMGAGDAIVAGFADHFLPEARWPELVAALTEGDPAVIADFEAEPPESVLAPLREQIDAAFEAADLAALSARLETSDWGHGVLRILRRQCPLSMACTLALVRAARRDPGVEKALAREYRFTSRAASDGELLEGVRAAVIDKDRTPVWRDDMDSLRPEEVAAMLAPLGAGELVLPDLAPS
jgi:enoyl-CoA hydratase/carnithine racemase